MNLTTEEKTVILEVLQTVYGKMPLTRNKKAGKLVSYKRMFITLFTDEIEVLKSAIEKISNNK